MASSPPASPVVPKPDTPDQVTHPPKKGKSLPPKLLIRFAKFVWTTLWQMMMAKLAPPSPKGDFVRPVSQFRHSISPEGNYPPAAGRYKLYVGLSCPWAHRTLVVRALKGLEDVIEVAIAEPSPVDGGWALPRAEEECSTLVELYNQAKPGYDGRSTVPVLWDKETKTIVNNESAEIIVILNSAFDAFAQHPTLDLYPVALQPQIDAWNDKIYTTVNNGVYRCGFAQSQEAYNEAYQALFATLDEIDTALETNRYLCGDQVTLADVRLFTTLFRFDVAYYGLFKCNRQRIKDYKNLSGYFRDLYQLPGVAQTGDFASIKQGYYGNLFPLNPGGIIPGGPDINSFWEPHGRDRLSQTLLPQD